jgi:uncharacterized protein (DUF433 family)
MTPTTHDYVTRTPEGGWRITGTRVSLDSVVHAYWDGRLPEAIAADFPSLTLEQVHGAIAHYLRNRAEVDRHLASQSDRWTAVRVESEARHGPLIRRIRDAVAPVPPSES